MVVKASYKDAPWPLELYLARPILQRPVGTPRTDYTSQALFTPALTCFLCDRIPSGQHEVQV